MIDLAQDDITAGVKCNYPGCKYTSNRWATLHTHIRKHTDGAKKSKGTYLHDMARAEIQEQEKARYYVAKAKAKSKVEAAPETKTKDESQGSGMH